MTVIIQSVPQTQFVGGYYYDESNPNLGANSSQLIPDVSAITQKSDDGLDPELVAFVNKVIASGLSDAVIMSLLAQVLVIANANRQKERELAIKEAFTSLELAKSAAANQKAAARQAFIGEIVSGSMTIAAGALDAGANAIGLAKTIKNDIGIKNDANRLYPKTTSPTEIVKQDLSSADLDDGKAPPSYESLQQEFNEKASLATALSLEENPHSSVDAPDAPDVSRETGKNLSNKNNDLSNEADVDSEQVGQNELARQQYIVDRERSYAAKMDARLRTVTGLTTLLTATGKILAANGNVESGNLNAQATIEKALADYLSARSANSGEYAQESASVIAAVIEAMNATNSNRHKAADTIWG